MTALHPGVSRVDGARALLWHVWHGRSGHGRNYHGRVWNLAWVWRLSFDWRFPLHPNRIYVQSRVNLTMVDDTLRCSRDTMLPQLNHTSQTPDLPIQSRQVSINPSQRHHRSIVLAPLPSPPRTSRALQTRPHITHHSTQPTHLPATTPTRISTLRIHPSHLDIQRILPRRQNRVAVFAFTHSSRARRRRRRRAKGATSARTRRQRPEGIERRLQTESRHRRPCRG